MTELQVRSLTALDVTAVVELDHSYHTDFVWQMDMQADEHGTSARFREIRLPRTMRVEYPREFAGIADDWKRKPGVLVAERAGEVLGYLSMADGILPGGALVTDLAVARRFRRQGVASALLRGAQTWANQHACTRIMLEMQSKNHPAICMAQKLGLEFCGYNDRYYANGDIALFFARSVG